MLKNPFESRKPAVSEEISGKTLISRIPEIPEGVVAIRSREDLKQVVEMPLLDACQYLYDLNIKTLMSSANTKNVEGNAYIDIDFDSLSEENKEVALHIGSMGTMHGSSQAPSVKITFPVNPTTTVDDIKQAAYEAVSKFNMQPLVWGRYTREELAGAFGMPPQDIVPEEWGATYAYDPESDYFYESQELLTKAKGS